MATDEKSLVFNFFGHDFCKEKGEKEGHFFFWGGAGGNFNLVLCFSGAQKKRK
jgi:hypothetical protein